MSLAFNIAAPERVAALDALRHRPGVPQGRGPRAVERDGRPHRERLRSAVNVLGGGAEVRRSTHRSPDGLARAAHGMLAQHDARVIDSLPTISVPTLVLVGENDTQFHAGTDYMVGQDPGRGESGHTGRRPRGQHRSARRVQRRRARLPRGRGQPQPESPVPSIRWRTAGRKASWLLLAAALGLAGCARADDQKLAVAERLGADGAHDDHGLDDNHDGGARPRRRRRAPTTTKSPPTTARPSRPGS